MKRTDAQLARESLEHLAMLQRHVAEGSWDAQMTVDAVCLRLAAAIDSASRLSERGRAEAFGDGWPAVWATRNRIVHGYTAVDGEIVRATVENDLGAFWAALDHLIDRPD
ncbi:HepT-like ribonuclease domain-containing protein [Promicromonospora sp. Marseille-Q5078]